MPDQLWVGDIGRSQIRLLPDQLRKAARLAIMELMDDPVPPEAIPYEGVANAYTLSTDNITIYHSDLGDALMIWDVRPNS